MIGATTLKVAGAAGSLLACGASAVVVAADTRPAAAPLKPPVAGAAAPAAVAVVDPAALVIPATGTCAAPASPAARVSPAPAPPAISAVVAQLGRARNATDRQTILGGLSPDQRMQVTAYLQLVAGGNAVAGMKPAQGRNLGLSCLGKGPGGSAAVAGVTPIAPSVVAGQAGAPLVISAVS